MYNKKVDMSVTELRDVEQKILNYMLLSDDNFVGVMNGITKEVFTFAVHGVIFERLSASKNIFLSGASNENRDLASKLYEFSLDLQEYHFVRTASTLDILSQPASTNITKDIEKIYMHSMENMHAIVSANRVINGTIETEDGQTRLEFYSGRLTEIGTTNIAKIPEEVHIRFDDVITALSKVDLKNGENTLDMSFEGSAENPTAIEEFTLIKNMSKLKWFYDIREWADKNNIDSYIFPRERLWLENLIYLNLSNKGITELPKEIGKLSKLRILILDNNNIKEFPKEIYQLKELDMLSFCNNKISSISEEIINIKGLNTLLACNNNIGKLPMNMYKLAELESLGLHGNKITMLPSEIGNLGSLTSLTISNNDIKALPKSISKLKNLKSLEIENTRISVIPVELVQNKSLDKLSVNDDLLAFVAKNIEYLDVDMINVSESMFKESSEIVKELNLNIDTQNWIPEEDNRDSTGAVLLFKYKDEAYKEREMDEYLNKFEESL